MFTDQVLVKYDIGGEEMWEACERMLEPHNERRWLDAELAHNWQAVPTITETHSQPSRG